MHPHQELLQQLRELIRSDEAQEAVELLLASEVQGLDNKELLQMQARIARLEKKKRMGLITGDEGSVVLNHINTALLDILKELEQLPEKTEAKTERNKKIRMGLMAGLVILLIGSVAAWWISSSKEQVVENENESCEKQWFDCLRRGGSFPDLYEAYLQSDCCTEEQRIIVKDSLAVIEKRIAEASALKANTFSAYASLIAEHPKTSLIEKRAEIITNLIRKKASFFKTLDNSPNAQFDRFGLPNKALNARKAHLTDTFIPLEADAQEYIISCWLKLPENVSEQHIQKLPKGANHQWAFYPVFYEQGGTDRTFHMFSFQPRKGKSAIRLANGQQVSKAQVVRLKEDIPVDRWIHVALAVDNNRYRLFIDGQQQTFLINGNPKQEIPFIQPAPEDLKPQHTPAFYYIGSKQKKVMPEGNLLIDDFAIFKGPFKEDDIQLIHAVQALIPS